jgi:YYY domain-containing protein
MAETETSLLTSDNPSNTSRQMPWLLLLLLALILIGGAYFRYIGLSWDTSYHLHPDERFLTMVETAISPVKNLGEYFNTTVSSLNPNNRGYGFYVYGTLPLFIVRYVAEWVNRTGYDQVNLVGRCLSALVDLMTVLLVFLTAIRLYKKVGIGLLAAAFAAFAVLPIQLSHFFTVDNFTNFFTFLAFYFATLLLDGNHVTVVRPAAEVEIQDSSSTTVSVWRLISESCRSVIPYVLFGIALGMAMASKVSVVPVAVLLPAAAFIYYTKLPKGENGTLIVRVLRHTIIRLSHKSRDREVILILCNLIIAGVAAFLVFRITQPYAFSGPSIFGLRLNPHWVANLKELASQSGGDVDFPPALQWARRPISFAWTNMVEWGMGLPLGLLAWAGFLWMAWRMLRGEWQKHGLIWFWTAIYFTFQSLNFTRSMRYQLPVYPTLEIMAGWAVVELWDFKSNLKPAARWLARNWNRILSGAIGAMVILGTLAWAYAFTRIYTRPVTRVSASAWIYQNVDGPINLKIDTGTDVWNQPLGYPLGTTLRSNPPILMAFKPRTSGMLKDINFGHIRDQSANGNLKTLEVHINEAPDSKVSLTDGFLTDAFNDDSDPRGKAYTVSFGEPLQVESGKTYYLSVDVGNDNMLLDLSGSLTLDISLSDGSLLPQALAEPVQVMRPGQDYVDSFTASQSGALQKVYFPWIVDWEGGPGLKTLKFSLIGSDPTSSPLGSAKVTSDFGIAADPRGKAYTFQFTSPVTVQKGETYYFNLGVTDGSGAIAVYGSQHADESTWDDALPLDLYNDNPFDYQKGVYQSDLNFEMYWDDNADKLQRFQSILSQADYIFSSSGREWATTVRVPERYPLTTLFYRDLLGCPDDKDIVWCYDVAQPGMFQGKLGFDLVYVQQSDPKLGSLRFNTQFAEEAFTVYDAPKVMIFRKNASYNPAQVSSILSSVDLSKVLQWTPYQASQYPGNLMLSQGQLEQDQANGTWADLFNRNLIFNQYPGLSMLLWYITITLLGWLVYPFVRMALGGLSDKGYPLARLIGIVLLAYMVWLAGSSGIAVTKLTISVALLLLAAVNAVLFYLQRHSIKEEWKLHKRYILIAEILALAFFTFFLLIRLGNPDLWHPAKGGEKPMDFSYFNAVLKSSTFPPYDPWFAGGYINYYYYGFVLIGVLVKWLGIIPSVAYNLILPTWFSMLAMGAFCIGWNLLKKRKPRSQGTSPGEEVAARSPDEASETSAESTHLIFGLERWPFLAGIASSVGLLILGNLGTVRMIWQGFQKLGVPGGNIDNLSIPMRWIYSFEGFAKFLAGVKLPYPPGDWYWIPSRVYPNEPITEFPFFTFLYADPHAHLIALPVTVLALAWGLSILQGKWQWGDEKGRYGWLHFICSFSLAGLVIGALRPTNTWDLPTYLALGVIVVLYTGIKYWRTPQSILPELSETTRRWWLTGACALLLVGLSFLFYEPFARWYGQGYTSFELWTGDHSPFWSYTTHWGLFLFVIISWMVWETRDWMAKTPVSALNKLRPYLGIIGFVLLMMVVAIFALLLKGVQIAWLVLPLMLWSAVLILRPGQPDVKRLVLFFIGTALTLTLSVELIVLKGDIGRMNTVFKFYLQAWTLFSLSAAAGLIWLLPAVFKEWTGAWRTSWQVGLVLLVGGAAMFTVLGGADKIRDRMIPLAPHTLDGMAYMQTAQYSDNGKDMTLGEDYAAIQWMQDNVKGSPVIVEANTVEYRWGTRFTIYTGLPGVVGWNWHQRQQRGGVVPTTWVTDRVDEIGVFFRTDDRQFTEDFIHKYNVSYIIVGQLEEAYYAGVGLEKFMAWDGELWKEVYHQGQTTIYKVLK